jgi:hypothetical protein
MLSTKEVAGRVARWEAADGVARGYSAEWFPNENSETNPARIINAKGVRAERDEDGKGGRLDAVQFVFSNWKQVGLYFAYFAAEAKATPVKDSQRDNIEFAAAGLAFYLRVFHLFEYIDEDKSGQFTKDVDTIVGWYNLSCGCLDWKPMKHEKETVNSTDGSESIKLNFFTFETADDVFTLRFVVTSHPIEIDGVKIKPDAVKVDIDIKYFGNPKHTSPKVCGLNLLNLEGNGKTCFTGPSNATTYPNARLGFSAFVGIKGGVIAGQRVAGGSEKSNGLTVQQGGNVGYFDWENEATSVAGAGVAVARKVAVSVYDDDKDETIRVAKAGGAAVSVVVFSIEGDRPEDVTYDPEMGLEAAEDSGASLAASLFALFSLYITLHF